MSSKTVPFYTQAALLDRYIHSENPNADADVVNLILNILRTKNELRTYFFRSGPSAVWAKILWNNGFLTTPPEPEKTNNGFMLKPWDVQYFLISVAPQVPEIVLKHVEALDGHGWYIARAIEALSKIHPSEAKKVLPKVLAWLSSHEIAEIAQTETLALINLMVKNGEKETALIIFEVLSAPRDEANSSITRDPYRELIGSKFNPSSTFELLKSQYPFELNLILEKHLVKDLYDVEPGKKKTSWWRNAIEDTEQDILNQYQDYILCGLRDTLLVLIETFPDQSTEIVNRYLEESRVILRRLGLYSISHHPNKFHDEVVREILNRKNLDDSEIHHEYFVLLVKGSNTLKISELKVLIKMILDGPDLERVEKAYENYWKVDHPDREKFISNQRNAWVRDRLMMINDKLDQQTKSILDHLIEAGGKPEHPEFLSWMSGVHRIVDVSPYSKFELSQFKPDQLYEFIKTWEPDPKEKFDPERVSYGGFASEIATLICSFSDRYMNRLVDIALLHSVYASEILNYWANPKFTDTIPWNNVIYLCEELLKNKFVWNNESQQDFDRANWRNVRMAIVHILKIYVTNPGKRVTDDFIGDIQKLLFQLIDDLDPSLEDDRPLKGWFGHNDPQTVAINHVRPIALAALIQSAVLITEKEKSTEVNIICKRVLNLSLREKFTQKLNPHQEPSSSVRSVFGLYLPTLYWLDQTWLIENLDRIFPNARDDESIWLFISAWDSYILNKFSHELFEIMKPKYERAVEYLSLGYATESHLQQASQLAGHLLFEFLNSEFDLCDFIQQKSLLVEFFEKTKPEIRSRAPWSLWRIYESNPEELGKSWPKAKSLWEWRIQEAVISNHSSDFDSEMLEFAQLFQVAPQSETIVSLQSFLNGLLPHIRKSESHDIGWSSVETFLARQVKSEPIEAIKFFRLMCEQKYTPPQWVYHSDHAKKIIEIAIDNSKSRVDTLALIDFFAQNWNDFTFKSLYQHYAGS